MGIRSYLDMKTACQPDSLRPPDHQACFACGPNNQYGLGLEFQPREDGAAVACWQPRRCHCSYDDRLHGGIAATLLDAAMLHALFNRGHDGVTVELIVRYSRGLSLDSPLEVLGWVDSSRHGVQFCRARIRQGGVTAVEASARFMTLPGRH